MSRFYAWAGGRKNGNGLLACLLLTAMAFPLDATFEAYGMLIVGCLGVTVASVAWEDAKRPKP